jgi:hypothetical protein
LEEKGSPQAILSSMKIGVVQIGLEVVHKNTRPILIQNTIKTLLIKISVGAVLIQLAKHMIKFTCKNPALTQPYGSGQYAVGTHPCY